MNIVVLSEANAYLGVVLAGEQTGERRLAGEAVAEHGHFAGGARLRRQQEGPGVGEELLEAVLARHQVHLVEEGGREVGAPHRRLPVPQAHRAEHAALAAPPLEARRHTLLARQPLQRLFHLKWQSCKVFTFFVGFRVLSNYEWQVFLQQKKLLKLFNTCKML